MCQMFQLKVPELFHNEMNRNVQFMEQRRLSHKKLHIIGIYVTGRVIFEGLKFLNP